MKISKIEDIYVIENLLSPSYIDALYEFFTTARKYGYIDNTSYTGTQNAIVLGEEKHFIHDVGQFVDIVIYGDSIGLQNADSAFLFPVYYTVKDAVPELKLSGIQRAKVNAILRGGAEHKNKFSSPHVDALEGYAGVLYLHDSDGDTVFFNQYKSTFEEKIDLSEPPIRITPKKNSLALFPANRVHASSAPTDTAIRWVINFVFTAQGS